MPVEEERKDPMDQRGREKCEHEVLQQLLTGKLKDCRWQDQCGECRNRVVDPPWKTRVVTELGQEHAANHYNRCNGKDRKNMRSLGSTASYKVQDHDERDKRNQHEDWEASGSRHH